VWWFSLGPIQVHGSESVAPLLCCGEESGLGVSWPSVSAATTVKLVSLDGKEPPVAIRCDEEAVMVPTDKAGGPASAFAVAAAHATIEEDVSAGTIVAVPGPLSSGTIRLGLTGVLGEGRRASSMGATDGAGLALALKRQTWDGRTEAEAAALRAASGLPGLPRLLASLRFASASVPEPGVASGGGEASPAASRARTQPPTHVIVMTRVPGSPLSTVLGLGRAADPLEALGWFGGLLSTLAGLHGRGILFADVHPGNVLVLDGTPGDEGAAEAAEGAADGAAVVASRLSTPTARGADHASQLVSPAAAEAGLPSSPAPVPATAPAPAAAAASPSPPAGSGAVEVSLADVFGGSASLVDLGSARRLVPQAEGGSPRYVGPTRGGSWAHMPPEQFAPGGGGPVTLDATCDVYSAAAVLLHALTGAPPFHPDPRSRLREASSRAAPLRQPVAAFAVLAPAMERALRRLAGVPEGAAVSAATQRGIAAAATVVAACLEPDPAGRPRSAEAVLLALSGTACRVEWTM